MPPRDIDNRHGGMLVPVVARCPTPCSTRSKTGPPTKVLLDRASGWASAMMPRYDPPGAPAIRSGVSRSGSLQSTRPYRAPGVRRRGICRDDACRAVRHAARSLHGDLPARYSIAEAPTDRPASSGNLSDGARECPLAVECYRHLSARGRFRLRTSLSTPPAPRIITAIRKAHADSATAEKSRSVARR